MSPKLQTPPKRNTRGSCNFEEDEIDEILAYKKQHNNSLVDTVAHFSTESRRLSKWTIIGWEQRFKRQQSNTDSRVNNGRKTLLCENMQEFIFKMYGAHRRRAHAITTPILLLLAMVCVDIGHQSGVHVHCCCTSQRLSIKMMRTMRKKWKIVYRCPTTSRTPISEADAKNAQENLALDVGSFMIENEITDPDMIINCDELGQHHLSDRAKTLEIKGERRVPVSTVGDKRAVTVVVAGSAGGIFLPPQIIYQGKTDAVHPRNFEFPPDWLISHTENHWATAKTMMQYIEKILVPYFNKVRERKPELTCPGMCIMDGFAGHITQEVYQKFYESEIVPVLLPPNMTHLLQPMDIAVCGTWKSHVRRAQEQFLIEQLKSNLAHLDNVESLTVDELAESVGEPPKGFVELKRASAAWFVEAHKTVSQMPSTIVKGFERAGLLESIQPLCDFANNVQGN